MDKNTEQKTRTRASNFYRIHCGTDDPTSAQVCAALRARAPSLRPNSFSTLKSQITSDQLLRGHRESAEEIRQMINPVTAPGSTMPRKPKPRIIKKIPRKDIAKLFNHLRAHNHHDEAAAVILAVILGVRPCEMRTISFSGNEAHIIGGKKSARLHRGADRTLLIENPKTLNAVKRAANILAKTSRTNAAIRDRLRKECKTLWPRRKKHPTLKSLRHNFSAACKAAGVPARALAYMLGQQAADSQDRYGDPRAGDTSLIRVRPAEGADLSKVRFPKSPPRYGNGRILEKIQAPQAPTNTHPASNYRKGLKQQSNTAPNAGWH